MKSIKMDYKFPMESPDKITVYQKLVPDPSRHLSAQSAFRLEVMILSEAHQRLAARCFEDIVIYDYKKNRKTVAIPPFVMEQFETMWEQQEQEKEKWRQHIADIENRVRSLELESWDRADAVEDNGSA
ncbi:thioesterase-like superfamily-domain-containing protein [Penicillium digitatum]|nr:thioesterase-like superfamily-domain-containing protein [Penicillium digitatum]